MTLLDFEKKYCKYKLKIQLKQIEIQCSEKADGIRMKKETTNYPVMEIMQFVRLNYT